MVLAKCALGGPRRRAGDEGPRLVAVTAIEGQDGRRVLHRPVYEGRGPGRPAERGRVALAAGVRKGARKGGQPLAEAGDALSGEHPGLGGGHRLEGAGLGEGRLAVALEGIEESLDEEALLDGGVPCGTARRAVERSAAGLDPAVGRVGREAPSSSGVIVSG